MAGEERAKKGRFPDWDEIPNRGLSGVRRWTKRPLVGRLDGLPTARRRGRPSLVYALAFWQNPRRLSARQAMDRLWGLPPSNRRVSREWMLTPWQCLPNALFLRGRCAPWPPQRTSPPLAGRCAGQRWRCGCCCPSPPGCCRRGRRFAGRPRRSRSRCRCCAAPIRRIGRCQRAREGSRWRPRSALIGPICGPGPATTSTPPSGSRSGGRSRCGRSTPPDGVPFVRSRGASVGADVSRGAAKMIRGAPRPRRPFPCR